MKLRKLGQVIILLICTLMFMVGCGGNTTTPPNKPVDPRDPQGNWLFILSGKTTTLNLAGQLYELNPPVVTSNPIGPVGQSSCSGSFTINGQASGVADIALTAQQINAQGTNVALSLTGTIATDQAHMSGNWTIKTTGDCLSHNETGGTWTAQLLTAVTGNWSGTLSNNTTNLIVTATLTENTDQTSPTMGQVTGTVTLLGSPCFPNAEAFTLPPWDSTKSPGVHGGETLILSPTPDGNNVSINTVGTVTPDGTSFTPLTFTIQGGACNGQSFTGQLSRI